MLVAMNQMLNSKTFRPIVDVLINGEPCQMRVDTGADASVVPIELMLGVAPSHETLTRDYQGNIKKEFRYPAKLSLDGFDFDLTVFRCECPCGLLGMDVLSQCSVEMYGGYCIIDPNKE